MSIQADMEQVLYGHDWTGGYFCQCGHELNSAKGWALHLASVLDEHAVIS